MSRDTDLRHRSTEDRPGEQARSGLGATGPHEIPWRGWVQVLKRSWSEAGSDHIALLAAGVAFFAFLGIFPALIAVVLLYGLVADPATVTRQVEEFGAGLPGSARDLLEEQMRSLTTTNQQSLGIGLAVALVAALWSASGAVSNLVMSVNIAYDTYGQRGFVKRRGMSVLMTLGAITFVLVAVSLVAVVPVVVDTLGLPVGTQVAVEVLRWLGLVLAMMSALQVLYRVAPDRETQALRWTSVGAVTATVVWLAVSAGFSLYVDNFSSYDRTYGGLAGVVVLLLWLWLSAYLVLFGAEVNAEAERQTAPPDRDGSS